MRKIDKYRIQQIDKKEKELFEELYGLDEQGNLIIGKKFIEDLENDEGFLVNILKKDIIENEYYNTHYSNKISWLNDFIEIYLMPYDGIQNDYLKSIKKISKGILFFYDNIKYLEEGINKFIDYSIEDSNLDYNGIHIFLDDIYDKDIDETIYSKNGEHFFDSVDDEINKIIDLYEGKIIDLFNIYIDLVLEVNSKLNTFMSEMEYDECGGDSMFDKEFWDGVDNWLDK